MSCDTVIVPVGTPGYGVGTAFGKSSGAVAPAVDKLAVLGVREVLTGNGTANISPGNGETSHCFEGGDISGITHLDTGYLLLV